MKRLQEDLKYYHNVQDPEENAKAQPVKDEEICLRCVWLFEVYPPNYTSYLIEGVKKIGLDISYRERYQKDLVELIKQCRHNRNASWIYLGYLIPVGKKSLHCISTELPEGISAINIHLHQHLPSTTVLSYQFILEDNEERILEKPLYKNHKTCIKKINKMYLFETPIHQKRKEINDLKKELHKKCSSWICENIPGFFSDMKNSFPRCDFITFKKGKPFNMEATQSQTEYIRILGLSNNNVWVCKENPALFLKVFPDENNILSNVILTGNMDEIVLNLGNNIEPYGGKNKFGITNYFEYISRALIIWVFFCLLDTYRLHLTKLRDTIAELEITDISSVSKTLKKLRKKIAKFENIIPYLVYEFKGNEKHKHFLFKDYGYKFLPYNEHSKKDLSINNMFLQSVYRNILIVYKDYENIKKSYFSISDFATAVINEKSTKKNLAIQIVMVLMTGIMLVFTILSQVKSKPLNGYTRTSDNTALPLRAAESQIMMSDK